MMRRDIQKLKLVAGELTPNINSCKGAKLLEEAQKNKIGKLDLTPKNMLKNQFIGPHQYYKEAEQCEQTKKNNCKKQGAFNQGLRETMNKTEQFRPCKKQFAKTPSCAMDEKFKPSIKIFNQLKENDNIFSLKSQISTTPNRQVVTKYQQPEKYDQIVQRQHFLPHQRTNLERPLKEQNYQAKDIVSEENLIYHQMTYLLPHQRTHLPKNKILKNIKPQDTLQFY